MLHECTGYLPTFSLATEAGWTKLHAFQSDRVSAKFLALGGVCHRVFRGMIEFYWWRQAACCPRDTYTCIVLYIRTLYR